MIKTQAQLPLTIISGYLGSGKTTLVNHLLRNANSLRLMVLVNDFGELPIDVDLIQSQDGNTINLANGCVCCSMGGDLFNALVDVLNMSPQPDHLLIEASGVADPARIANIALAEPDLRLDAIISLVDAETFEGLIDDPFIGETMAHQLSASDIILLNKLDLVEKLTRHRVDALLDKIAPDASRVDTNYSRAPLGLIVGLKLGDDTKKQEQIDSGDHTEVYSKWSKTFETCLDKFELEKALDNCSGMILRLKGIVHLEGMDTPHVVQCVYKRWTITPVETTLADLHTVSSTKSRLVAIGLASKLDLSKLDTLFSTVSK